MLFVTHDMGVVADIATRVAVMHQGRIVETGSTAEILRRPKRDYTRDLLMAVPSLVPRPVRPAVSADIVLQTEALRKVYSDSGLFRRARPTVAAADVSFALRRGRTLGIVGESGSGKSTVGALRDAAGPATSGGIACSARRSPAYRAPRSARTGGTSKWCSRTLTARSIRVGRSARASPKAR